MRRTLFLLFITHLLTRILFSICIGFYNNYSLQNDSSWLVNFGNNVLVGDFNFDIKRFIVSPLFPTLCGLFKFLFGMGWNSALIIFQLLISSLSGVYIFKITELLFRNKKISLLSSLIFAVFPLTLWYVNTFSQECLFQSLLIITVYFLLKSLRYPGILNLVLTAILFSFTYLTKAHILLFSVFIPIIYFHNFGYSNKTLIASLIFISISLLFSLPYGLYHYKKNNIYVISSNGSSYQLYLGNTEAGYKSIVDVPEKNSPDYLKIKDINASAGYFNGSQARYDSLLLLPQYEKTRLFSVDVNNWIKGNLIKFLKLKLYDVLFFLMPGVSFRHYSFLYWLLSFILSFPLYLFAYIAILRDIRYSRRNISVILYLFLSMLMFSVFWYVQNRFRTITIEPF